jgi:hypothetical protein
VEIGALQVAGQEAISDLRPLFPGKIYIGCDMRSACGRVATDDCRSSLRREVVEKTSAKYGEALEGLTASRLYVDQQDETLSSRQVLLGFWGCFAQALWVHLEYCELGIFKDLGEGGRNFCRDPF